MSGRVRIGTCANAIDAAFVRSMFEARGFAVVIGAEHHASLLGPIHGAFLTLDIWVDGDDAEDAAQLLHDLRTTDADQAPDPTADADAQLDDDDGEWRARPAASSASGGASASAADDDLREVIERRARGYQRRRFVISVLSGLVLTFGTAHMFTGAWLRGLALAGVEVYGLMLWSRHDVVGGYLAAGAVAFDVLGTIVRAIIRSRASRAPRAAPVEPRERSELPRAQIKR